MVVVAVGVSGPLLDGGEPLCDVALDDVVVGVVVVANASSGPRSRERFGTRPYRTAGYQCWNYSKYKIIMSIINFDEM